MAKNDHAERHAGNPSSTLSASQAQVNSWLAAKLDEFSEGGRSITAGTFSAVADEASQSSPFGAFRLRCPFRALRCICVGISSWLQDAGVDNRPLTPAELQSLATHVREAFGPELRSIAVHDPGAGQYHVPLFEGPFLTVNLHAWEPGEWTSDHDHGGAGGGIAVLQGALVEEIYAGRSWTEVKREQGASYSFGHWIHRMGRADASGTMPISIHAYSGPDGGLTQITSFHREADGSLTPIRTWRKGDQAPGSGCPCSLGRLCGLEEDGNE